MKFDRQARVRPFAKLGTLLLVTAALLFASHTNSTVAITDAAIIERVDQIFALVTKNQNSVSAAIDLHEAMARALKYNLDFRLELVRESGF